MTTSEPIAPAVVAAEYTAALEDVVWYDASANGRLRLTDRDRAELLHRLSTNDTNRLKPGDGLRTALVNYNARIIDVLTVYALPEHLLVTTSADQSSAIMRMLRKNIFFKDRVTVEDLSAETLELHLYGPQAAGVAAQISSVDPRDWPPYHIQAVTGGDAQGWLARIAPLGGAGFALFAQVADRDAVLGALGDIPRLSEPTFDVLRVEAGYPIFGRELSLEYIPLQTRLDDAVSFTKGCYVGQEIIARMESRNRRAKQLMGLRLSRQVEA